MPDLIIRGRTVVDGSADTDARRADVAIEDGRVTAIEDRLSASGATEIDADGLVVPPGSSTSTPTTTPRSSGTRR